MQQDMIRLLKADEIECRAAMVSEKGQASDSFKRACFNWGIGRELYTAPFICIPAGKADIQSKETRDREKKYYCYDRFCVNSIEYNDDKEISASYPI